MDWLLWLTPEISNQIAFAIAFTTLLFLIAYASMKLWEKSLKQEVEKCNNLIKLYQMELESI